jgi:nucleotide-binding universal stress UspA family protein
MTLYPTVVVGTDGSATATKAARSAALLAERLDAELLLAAAFVRTRPHDLGPPSDRAGAGEELISSGYRGAAETAQDTCIAATKGLHLRSDTAAVEGDPADALLSIVEQRPGSLLVVGSKGMTDSARFLLGSVPNKVSHHAVGDVLIVLTDKAAAPVLPARILVGTDGSKTALRAVDRAIELAVGLGSSLTILSAGSERDTEPALAEAAERARNADISWNTAARDEDPATAIVDAAREHDMIVVGNRGMTGAARFLLGSVPNKVSHHLNADLLIVKTDRA